MPFSSNTAEQMQRQNKVRGEMKGSIWTYGKQIHKGVLEKPSNTGYSVCLTKAMSSDIYTAYCILYYYTINMRCTRVKG